MSTTNVESVFPKVAVFPGKFGTSGLFSSSQRPPKIRESLDVALSKACRGNKAAKLQFFAERVVLVSAFENAWKKARFLIDQAEHIDRPGGLKILAEGGCGKTFLAEQLAQDYPTIDSTYELLVPIVFVYLRSQQDEKDVMISMLIQLGERIKRNDLTASELEKK